MAYGFNDDKSKYDLSGLVAVERFSKSDVYGAYVTIDVAKDGYTPVGIISITDGLDIADVTQFGINSAGNAYIGFNQSIAGDTIRITVLYLADISD